MITRRVTMKLKAGTIWLKAAATRLKATATMADGYRDLDGREYY